MVNSSDDLSILDNGDRDAMFMVWDNNRQYLAMLKSYYPDGMEEEYKYGPNRLLHLLPRQENRRDTVIPYT